MRSGEEGDRKVAVCLLQAEEDVDGGLEGGLGVSVGGEVGGQGWIGLKVVGVAQGDIDDVFVLFEQETDDVGLLVVQGCIHGCKSMR
jgi:hypothetical protein